MIRIARDVPIHCSAERPLWVTSSGPTAKLVLSAPPPKSGLCSSPLGSPAEGTKQRSRLSSSKTSSTFIQFSESFEIDGAEMLAHTCKVGLEGVVSKVRDSNYVSGRGNSWVKKTCAQRETLTIAGFALDGNDWDGIYLGRRKGDALIYAGKVDHGFTKASAMDLRQRLKPLIRKTQPYAKKIAHKAVWVEPQLMAEIEYRAKSAEGTVRQPFFKGVREDT